MSVFLAKMSKPVFALSLWGMACRLMRGGKTIESILEYGCNVTMWEMSRGLNFPNALYIWLRSLACVASLVHTGLGFAGITCLGNCLAGYYFATGYTP